MMPLGSFLVWGVDIMDRLDGMSVRLAIMAIVVVLVVRIVADAARVGYPVPVDVVSVVFSAAAALLVASGKRG